MNKQNKAFVVCTIVLLLAGAIIGAKFYRSWMIEKTIVDFDSCAVAGYTVMESYPGRCRTPDGRTFVENIGNELEKTDLIQIQTPRPNSVVSSPLIITGKARGNWYFEAQFPVRLLDENGTVLASGPASAKGECKEYKGCIPTLKMTSEFVPFDIILTFEKPAAGTKGTLILLKDNPSGLPENDDELRVPVRFN